MRIACFGALVLVATVLGCRDGADDVAAVDESAPHKQKPVERDDSGPAAVVQPTPPRSRRATLAAVGDILFGRYRLDKFYKRVPRIERPFADVRSIFAAADIVVGNLESPMVAQPEVFYVTANPALTARPSIWSLTFRADPADGAVLARAGFDVISLANNHARDMGKAAVSATRRNVARAGLTPIGVGATPEEARKPAIIEANGLRIAVVGWTLWLKGLPATGETYAVAYTKNRTAHRDIAAQIAQLHARGDIDFIVVSIHWGWEYKPAPDSDQRRIAHALIDAGADVVVGHHPHVVQTFERYHGGLIAYSLGNFVFDAGRLARRRSLVMQVDLELTAAGQRSIRGILHPIILDANHAPRLARRRSYRAWRRILEERAPAFDIAVEPPPTP